jgi:hypothetical protein
MCFQGSWVHSEILKAYPLISLLHVQNWDQLCLYWLVNISLYRFLTITLILAYRYKLVSVLYSLYKSYDCLYWLTDINKYKLLYRRTILLSLTNYHCIRIYNSATKTILFLSRHEHCSSLVIIFGVEARALVLAWASFLFSQLRLEPLSWLEPHYYLDGGYSLLHYYLGRASSLKYYY